MNNIIRNKSYLSALKAVGCVFGALCVFYFMRRCLDTNDLFFMQAVGDEILQNGIPHVNVWTIDTNQKFIAQQWLYAVLISLFDKFSVAGLMTFVGMQLAVFCVLCFYVLRHRNINAEMSVFLTFLTLLFGSYYIFSIRPELVTLVLLLVEIVGFENYYRTDKTAWLVLFPVSVFLEINLHGSMWPFHFAIAIAYVVPLFSVFRLTDTKPISKWKLVAAFSIISILVLFLNPYGLDGIMYVIKSFSANSFVYMPVTEMTSPRWFDTTSLTLTLCGVLFAIGLKFRCLSSVTMNMTAGFWFISAMYIRNSMFLPVCLIFLLSDISKLEIFHIDLEAIKKQYAVGFVAFAVFVAAIFTGYFIVQITSNRQSAFETLCGIYEEMYDLVQQDYNPDMRVFTGFDDGGFFQAKGMKNLYIDLRPEIYTSAFTGDKNLLRDYSYYCVYGYDSINRADVVDSDKMQAWFGSYDFDYIIVYVNGEMNLASYMTVNQNYKLIEEFGYGDRYDICFRVYKRC